MLKLLPLLFLMGCAANQSALPMPVPFEPTEDAPIFIGQPGTTTAPEPEHSPHKRILPQTPETRKQSGVWAGDGVTGEPPLRKRGEPIPKIAILAVPVPLHPDFKDALETTSDEMCAHITEAEIYGATSELSARVWRLTPADRLCLIAKMHYRCLKGMTAAYHAPNNRRYDIDTGKNLIKAAGHAAREWVMRVCSMDHAISVIDRLLEDLWNQPHAKGAN